MKAEARAFVYIRTGPLALHAAVRTTAYDDKIEWKYDKIYSVLSFDHFRPDLTPNNSKYGGEG